MDLLQPLDAAIAAVKAEVAILELRLQQVIIAVQKRADVLGVEMPTGNTPIAIEKKAPKA